MGRPFLRFGDFFLILDCVCVGVCVIMSVQGKHDGKEADNEKGYL